MMQMRWGAAVLFLLGCARGLELPNVTPLSASPSTATVAPREPKQLTASGGTPPYTFALVQKQSGDRAAVGTDGFYVAGDDGPAADVVRLSDSAGAKVDVAIAVGPSLALSPASALTAPGGRVVFTATGGKRPYAFKVLEGPGTIGADGAYVAGAGGDTVSKIQVRDATPDGSAVVEVHVGPTVSVLPKTAAIAPYATLDFVAIGGQPPYRYSVVSADGATVNAATGHYQAGAGSGTAAVQDTVTVTDALDQSASALITTGPPLAAQAPAELHPFTAVRLVPTGGLPPYSFAFADRGNRSRGAVDAVTGLYTPGSNFGTSDLITVRDATPGGQAKLTLQMPAVGSLQLPAQLSRGCLAADMDGDGRQDAVLYNPTSVDTPSRIDIELMQQDGPPVIIRNNILDIRAVASTDLNGDGRDDLVVQDTTSIRAYLSNSDGSLAPSILVANKTQTTTVPMAISKGAGGAHSIWFRDDPVDVSACSGNTTVFMRADWPARASAPGAAVCAAPAKVGGVSKSSALAFGDFNHDGTVDLAQVAQGALRVYFGADYFAATPVVLSSPDFSFGQLLVTDLDGDGIDDVVSQAVRNSDGRSGLTSVNGSTGSLAIGTWVDPIPSDPNGVGFTLGSLVAAPGHELFGATRVDGAIHRIGPDLAPRDPQPATQAFTVACVALPDINADGAPDLLASGNGSNTAVVLAGDGDGTYGRRPHYHLGALQVAADIDSDGIDDVLYRTGPFTLQVLFGGNHLLALGPETAVASSFSFVVGSFYGAARRDLFIFTTSGFSIAQSIGDGTFAPPEIIHTAQGPVSTDFLLSPARLGGAGPGTDFIGVSQIDLTTIVPFVHTTPGQPSLVTALSPVAGPGTNCSPPTVGVGADQFVDFDGDGFADLYEICDEGTFIGRSTGSGAGITFSWSPVPDNPFGGQVFIGTRLASGHVPISVFNSLGGALGSFFWNGSAWELAMAAAPEIPKTGTMDMKVVNLGDGGEAILVNRDVLLEYKEKADGTLNYVRSFSPGKSYLPLAPGAGKPVDLLLSAKSSSTQLKEATLFVNAGNGTFN